MQRLSYNVHRRRGKSRRPKGQKFDFLYVWQKKYKKKMKAEKVEFYRTFNKPLWYLLDVKNGFDYNAFVKYLEIPYEINTKTFISKIYGKKAVRLIERLLI